MSSINPHLTGLHGSSMIETPQGVEGPSNKIPAGVDTSSRQGQRPIVAGTDLPSIPQAPSISLPKGGGSIRSIGEKFEVNTSNGTAATTIPIHVSTTRHGVSPNLSLSYNSGAGNSVFGLGWQLGGLSSVTRKTDKGLPRYCDWADDTESDVFVLAGAEDLVPVFKQGQDGSIVRDSSGVPVIEEIYRNGYVIRRYMPRIEGAFTRIERWCKAEEPADTHWRTTSSSNLTTVLGSSANSRIFDPSSPEGKTERIMTWMVAEIWDANGNAMIFDYLAEDSTNVDTSLACEAHRTDKGRSANRYIKTIKYGNLTPNRNLNDWTPISAFSLRPEDWTFCITFDYGEHDRANPLPDDRGKWECRQDPFSTYRAGFEIRTYRLCRRILMYHCFKELGNGFTLVSSTDLTYEPTPVATYLVAATQTGYASDTQDRRAQKSMPAITFEYSRFPDDDQLAALTTRELDNESMENITSSLDSKSFKWVDIDGEGIPSLLSEQSGAWFIKRNLSGVDAPPREDTDSNGPSTPTLGPLTILPTRPSQPLTEGFTFFGDVAGGGKLDLITLSTQCWGYHERNRDGDWENFQQFPQFPNIPPNASDMKLVDLTGDGLIDILICADKIYYWYQSLGAAGYKLGGSVTQPLDDVQGPTWVFSDTEATIYLADMSGDGLSDLCRIERNGGVSYWPNLGYGKFGDLIRMDNPPLMDCTDVFGQERVTLADIDGSGTTDIVYYGAQGAILFANQSGNNFTDGKRLGSYLPIDRMTEVSVVDIWGNGTGCLLWSTVLPHIGSSFRYLDLMQGQKPHLLVGLKNSLGGETKVTYATSTKFYFLDKLEGLDWITTLRFPVHCVEKQETIDHVSGNKFTTRYRYHHGYFDPTEREFRGFARVDRWDAEEFGTGQSDATNLDSGWRVPPVLVRSWYHTGISPIDGVSLSRMLQPEYFSSEDSTSSFSVQPDYQALAESFVVHDNRLDSDEVREASRALKGHMIRQEIYSDTDGPDLGAPYQITENAFTVRAIQGVQDANLHAVFFVHHREDISYDLDLDPNDPRVSHNLTLQVDQWGNVEKGLAVAYGRLPGRSKLDEQDRLLQEKHHFSYFETSYTNDVVTDDNYRLRMSYEHKQYELAGLFLATSQAIFDRNDFVKEDFQMLTSLVEVPYDKSAAAGLKRLILHEKLAFRKDDLTGLLEFGKMQPLALPGKSYKLCLTAGLLEVFKKSSLGQGPPENLIPDPTTVLGGSDAGYIDLDSNGNWWQSSDRAYYHINPSANPAAELQEARQHFFMPRRFEDEFGAFSSIDYDDYSMFVVSVTNAVRNTSTAVIDYRILSPSILTDENGNQSIVKFDALGMVAGTAVMGKPGEKVGDDLENFKTDISQAECDAFFENPRGPIASQLLGHATTRYIYDLDRFSQKPGENLPSYSALIARETHTSDLLSGQTSKLVVTISFSDGLGRTIQTKMSAESGSLVVDGPISSDRWLTSAWTIFNNKGSPVRTFEPFFDEGCKFRRENMIGVASTSMYDPMGRTVATLSPNHAFQKVEYKSWMVRTFDLNDTVGVSDPRKDETVGRYFELIPTNEYLPSWYDQQMTRQADKFQQEAAVKAKVHNNTPTTVHYDALGRVILNVSDNGIDGLHKLRSTYDVQSNVLDSYDALGHLIIRNQFDVCGNCIHVASAEAGERWTLVDVSGNIMLAWTSRRGRHRTTYDAMRRPLDSFWTESDGVERLAQRTIYGEDQPDSRAHNLNGKVVKSMDQAGIMSTTDYDYKGNILQSSRQFAVEYKNTLDWSQDVALVEEAPHRTEMTYDAFNRPIWITSPDGTITLHRYNQQGKVYQVAVNLKGESNDPDSTWPLYVKEIQYDAKEQIQKVLYGNDAILSRTYDPKTYRLTRLVTSRTLSPGHSEVLQDLAYTYDPIGNVTHIQDSAIQTTYFRNTVVEPSNDYTYDAMYRLKKASGREHLTAGGARSDPTASDDERTRLAHPGDGNAMALYTEEYTYDKAGNMTLQKHSGSDQTKPGWTKIFSYEEKSGIPGRSENCNKLSRTTVGNITELLKYEGDSGRLGCVTSMPGVSDLRWDMLDQLRSSVRQIVNNGGTPETTYYVYDSSGIRVRKVTERYAAAGEQPTMLKERLYLGLSERYREFAGNGKDVTLERESVHVPGVSNRTAIVETRTQGEEDRPARSIRYQFGNLLGSAVLQLDEAAQIVSYEEYYPFGSTSCQTVKSEIEIPNRYRFTGKEKDEESGLYYHGARYYAPWIMRWISADPAGVGDGLNLYEYCTSNPVKHVDMTGFAKKELTPEQLAQKRAQAETNRIKGEQARIDISEHLDEIENDVSTREYGLNRSQAGSAEYDRVPNKRGPDSIKNIDMTTEAAKADARAAKRAAKNPNAPPKRQPLSTRSRYTGRKQIFDQLDSHQGTLANGDAAHIYGKKGVPVPPGATKERLVVQIEGARDKADMVQAEEWLKKEKRAPNYEIKVLDKKDVDASKALRQSRQATTAEHAFVQNEKGIANSVKNLASKAADSKLGQAVEKVATKAAPVAKVLGHLGGALDIVGTAHSIKEDIDTLRTSDSMGEKAVAALDIAGNALMLIPTPQTKAIGMGITMSIAAGKMLYDFFKAPDPPPKPNTPPIEVYGPPPPEAFCNS